MTDTLDYRPVLRAYAADCQPRSIEFLAGAGGFSGARLWRLTAPRGTLCLRRWPPERFSRDRIEFIQAVLWHVHQEGFTKVAVPIETTTHAGYVRHAGAFWELAPWLPGAVDYRAAPSPARLVAAMTALAEFHLAAALFPLAETSACPAPGVASRAAQLKSLTADAQARLRHDVMQGSDEHQALALRILELFPRGVADVARQLKLAMSQEVALQPCLRDTWHENVLFVGDEVSGLIDYGAMRPETVAADVARLLGSMAEDDAATWRAGLAAYRRVRHLTAAEEALVSVYDASGVLLGGINWLTWLYGEQRKFDSAAAVDARLTYFCRRLARWTG